MNSDSDSDIDIDDDEILMLQRKLYTNSYLQNQIIVKEISLTSFKPKYTQKCQSTVEKYKKSGMEINAFLRGTLPYDSNIEKIIFKLDQCFQSLSTLFPTSSIGNYIKSYRTMSQKFDADKTAGYTSTSNQFVGMSSKYLYTIYIPSDSNIIIIDISKETGTPNTYEIVLERNVGMIDIGNNTFVVNTSFSRNNLTLFKNI